jgi:hypothetical protein
MKPCVIGTQFWSAIQTVSKLERGQLDAGNESGSPSSPICEKTHADDLGSIEAVDSRITVSRQIQLKAIVPCRKEVRPVRKASIRDYRYSLDDRLLRQTLDYSSFLQGLHRSHAREELRSANNAEGSPTAATPSVLLCAPKS